MSRLLSDAIELHSRSVESFDSRYQRCLDFAERRALWTALIHKYSSKDGQVLDVGCGSGVMTFVAASHNRSVLGIDGSAEMVAFCRQKQIRCEPDNVSFRQSMLEDLPELGIDPVDLLLCSSVLEYVEDLDLSMELLAGLLKPGGVMIVSLPNKSACYRTLERYTFKVIGRPAYLACVRNVLTLPEFNRVARSLGFECLESYYYGSKWPALRLLARRVSAVRFHNLFAGVYRKSKA